MTVKLTTPDDLHPYQCLGPGKCIHCDKKAQGPDHDPKTCNLCNFDPED